MEQASHGSNDLRGVKSGLGSSKKKPRSTQSTIKSLKGKKKKKKK
jgi:hypothetical protein